jgi:hypothetical protein
VFFGGNYNQRILHLIKKKHVPDYILRSVSSGDTGDSEWSRNKPLRSACGLANGVGSPIVTPFGMFSVYWEP